MKRLIASYLFLLVLFTGIGFTFHQHEDGLIHDDCPTCIATSHHNCIIFDIHHEVSRDIIEFVLSLYNILPLSIDLTTNISIRAPPSFY